MLGQGELMSDNDQLYSGSGDADTVQFSITCLLMFTVTVWFEVNRIVGSPAYIKTVKFFTIPVNQDLQ